MTVKTSKSSKPTQKRQAMQERRLRVLEMRKAGMTYAQISDALDIHTNTVIKDIQALTKPHSQHYAIELAIDLQRIEMALLPLSKAVRNGDHKSIDRWKQLIDMKQKLLGNNQSETSDTATLQIKVISEVELEKI